MNAYLAYAPRGPGLRCALAYLDSPRDACGWFTGLRADATVASGYFLLENVHGPREPRFETVAEADLHGRWGLDEARRHELSRMQETFVREWLFRRDDPAAAHLREAYAAAELGLGEINVRPERLARFSTEQPNWTYASPRFEGTVLRQLAKRWPLEYRPAPDD